MPAGEPTASPQVPGSSPLSSKWPSGSTIAPRIGGEPVAPMASRPENTAHSAGLRQPTICPMMAPLSR